MGRKRMNKRPFTKKYIKEVPNIPGVYELLSGGGETVYVGKSNRLRERLYDHLRELKDVKFFRVRFMPPKAAEKFENKIIKKKKPKYNRRMW